MIQTDLIIAENTRLSPDIYKLVLKGDIPSFSSPGRFINIAVKDGFLRRPISISSRSDEDLSIIFKIVGKGTRWLSQCPMGKKLNVLLPLGNGFFMPEKTNEGNWIIKDETGSTSFISNDFIPVIVGGGIGIPPLLGLAKELIKLGFSPTVVLGFRSDKDIILIEDFKKLNINVLISTEDGTVGEKGFVTDIMKKLTYNYIYSCGPMGMLKALYPFTSDNNAQFSLEARMACGFGACMGCTCETKNGYKRICKEGPVFFSKELIW